MTNINRNGWILLAIAGFIGIVTAYPVTAAESANVTIDNFSFVPDTLTISLGTTVTWDNRDDIPHSVVFTDKSFHSKPLDTHDRASFTFTKPGTVDYFCGLHPHMHATIIVTP